MSADSSFGFSDTGEYGSAYPGRPTAEVDALVMKRLARGEPTALGELMETYWGGLVQYATTLIGCRDAGEDVAQAVFVHVWETRRRWTESGSVAGYLYRIARNLSVARTRHEAVRARRSPDILQLVPRGRSPLEATQHTEFEAALEEALRTLPPRRREAFELVRCQGLSLADAGSVMGVSRRTVANHLYLGALDLAEKLRRFRD